MGRTDDAIGNFAGQRSPPRPEDAEPDWDGDRSSLGQPRCVEHFGGRSVHPCGLPRQELPHGGYVLDQVTEGHGPLTHRQASSKSGAEARPDAALRDPRHRGQSGGHGHHRALSRDQHGRGKADAPRPLGGQGKVDERVLPQRSGVVYPNAAVAKVLGQHSQVGKLRSRG